MPIAGDVVEATLAVLALFILKIWNIFSQWVSGRGSHV